MSQWYFAGADQRVKGPVEEVGLLDALLKMPDGRAALVWRDGLVEWMRADDVPEISCHLRPLPPPLPKVVSKPQQTLPELPVLASDITNSQQSSDGRRKGALPAFMSADLTLYLSVVICLVLYALLVPVGSVFLGVKALDPILLIPAALGGWFTNKSRNLFLVALSAAVLQETILFAINEAREFRFPPFGAAVVDGLVISTLAYGIRRWRTRIVAAPRSVRPASSIWNDSGTLLARIVIGLVFALLILCIGAVVAVIATR